MADHLGWAERVNVSEYRILHPEGAANSMSSANLGK
jgi:hypothetical protein